MATIYNKRPRRRSGTSHTIPIIAVSSLCLAMLLGGYFLYSSKIKEMFEGKPAVVVYSNKEANDNLDLLLNDLAGSKSQLLDLFENSRTRLSWIQNPTTRRQFRWLLMERLIDCGEWKLATSILPEVELLASIDQLDRLAEAAILHKDIELQQKLDQHLQKKALNEPSKIRYLLRSVRRDSETRRMLNRADQTMATLAVLENPLVQSRLTDPRDAAEAAALLMMRAEESEVKAPILQKVRNILQAANWPSCPATAELIIEEATSTMNDNPVMSDAALREVENKLLKSRDAMFTGAEKPELLMQCYILLGETRFRLKDYPGASQALSMAEALAEGSGVLNEELKVKLMRMRAQADHERGALDEAMIAYRYLAEMESNEEERLRSLLFMADNTHGEDKLDFLKQSWDVMKNSPKSPQSVQANKERVSSLLAELYEKSETWTEAVKWMEIYVELMHDAHQGSLDVTMLELRKHLALLHRKAMSDQKALNILKEMCKSFSALSEEDLDLFKKNNSKLYKDIQREFARTYVLMGDTYTARQVVKKIGEDLPAKVR